MSGAVPATLKLHPDTRLSNGSAAQLIAGLALDPWGPTWAVGAVERLSRPVPQHLEETPGQPVSAQLTERLRSKPGPGIRLSRLVLLAVAAVVAAVISVVTAVISVVAAVVAAVAPAVHAVCDYHGTADGGNGPPAASG